MKFKYFFIIILLLIFAKPFQVFSLEDISNLSNSPDKIIPLEFDYNGKELIQIWGEEHITNQDWRYGFNHNQYPGEDTFIYNTPEKNYLDAPWWILWKTIDATIGNDMDVTVEPLDSYGMPYIIPIKVIGFEKAVAIATLMTLHHQLGNITVDIEIRDERDMIVFPIISPLSKLGAADLFQLAMSKNDWFIKVMHASHSNVIYPVFKKEVLQISCDNIGDFYGNCNQVVALAFRDYVLKPAIGDISLLFSTNEY